MHTYIHGDNLLSFARWPRTSAVVRVRPAVIAIVLLFLQLPLQRFRFQVRGYFRFFLSSDGPQAEHTMIKNGELCVKKID